MTRRRRRSSLFSVLALAWLGAGCGDAPAMPRGDAGGDARVEPPPARVPDEVADEEALTELAGDWLPTLPATPRRFAMQSSEDRLRDPGPLPTPLLDQGNRDMNHFVCIGEGSSVGRGLVPHIVDLERCPEPWARGAVLARFEGSGVMVRFWLTALSIRYGGRSRARLRVYVDDDREARIDVPLSSVVDGSAGEIFAPPFGAGAVDHVAWYYPVVFSERLIVALDDVPPLDLVYHQTLVALDPTPRARSAPARRLDTRDAAAASLLASGDAAGTIHEETLELAAGESREIVLSGPALLRELALGGTREQLGLARVSVRWDGASEPAIDTAALALFGATLGDPPSEGAWLRASPEGEGATLLSLRLPAPFEREARIAVAAPPDRGLTLRARLATEPLPARAVAWGHLHAIASETSAPAPVHPLAHLTGPGRLAGVCLAMEGRAEPDLGSFSDPHNFLEGDERIALDGHELRGTGTEDYLDGSFYFEGGPPRGPFAAVWGVVVESESEGRATGCRWHVGAGALDFASSLDAELEVGGAAPATLRRFRSVAYVYR